MGFELSTWGFITLIAALVIWAISEVVFLVIAACISGAIDRNPRLGCKDFHSELSPLSVIVIIIAFLAGFVPPAAVVYSVSRHDFSDTAIQHLYSIENYRASKCITPQVYSDYEYLHSVPCVKEIVDSDYSGEFSITPEHAYDFIELDIKKKEMSLFDYINFKSSGDIDLVFTINATNHKSTSYKTIDGILKTTLINTEKYYEIGDYKFKAPLPRNEQVGTGYDHNTKTVVVQPKDELASLANGVHVKLDIAYDWSETDNGAFVKYTPYNATTLVP